MEEKIFTVKNFREIFTEIVHADHTHFSHGKDGGFREVLQRLKQMSDDELLDAKLYADLGLDSIDIWEMVCMFERNYDINITDEVDSAIGSGDNLTVASYLQALETHRN